jgi:hypothetical protein
VTVGPAGGAPVDTLRAFLADPSGKIAVGRLHEAVSAALAATSPVVFLSADTLAKQRREHPELTESEYLMLPAVLVAPDLVLQWEELRVAVLRAGPHDERKDVRRMLRKATVIFGEAESWSRR